MQGIALKPGKKIYFASDFHLGIPSASASLAREKRICAWLEVIKEDAQQIYLLGDLFDAWIEYKTVVPAGFIRFLGKLAECADMGIELIIFTGNHDLWMSDYFIKELNATIYKEAITLDLGGKCFHIGHGDGLVKEEGGYLLMRTVFHHPVSQWLYRLLHPNIGLGIAKYFSNKGVKHRELDEKTMKADEQEYQIIYAKQMLENQNIDYFVFGHRHIPVDRKLNDRCHLINLGDWIQFDTYAEFNGKELTLRTFTP